MYSINDIQNLLIWEVAMRLFSQLHMLVNLEYYFLCGSFGLKILHTCNQYDDVFTPKIPWAKQISSILGTVSKLVALKLFSQLLHVGKSCISSFSYISSA